MKRTKIRKPFCLISPGAWPHVLAGSSWEGVADMGWYGHPGPFDYAQGICLMQNVAKYDALYGVNVQAELRRRLELPAGSAHAVFERCRLCLG